MRVAVDTNILLRLIVDDGSAHAAAVERLARAHHLIFTPTALLETEWVLRRVLRLERDQILAGFERLLGLATATFLHRDLVRVAIRAFGSGCDFADALHAVSATGAEVFATFDRDFARRAKSLQYLPPVRLVPATGTFTA
jgi:predicted nucleic-acid-binding protein